MIDRIARLGTCWLPSVAPSVLHYGNFMPYFVDKIKFWVLHSPFCSLFFSLLFWWWRKFEQRIRANFLSRSIFHLNACKFQANFCLFVGPFLLFSSLFFWFSLNSPTKWAPVLCRFTLIMKLFKISAQYGDGIVIPTPGLDDDHHPFLIAGQGITMDGSMDGSTIDSFSSIHRAIGDHRWPSVSRWRCSRDNRII